MRHDGVGANSAIGELWQVLGVVPMPYPYAFRPNVMVTFRNPYTGRNAMVPLRLPDSTPRMVHLSGSVIFNYGDYPVEARFLPDGSVDVIYNSGLMRPLKFD